MAAADRQRSGNGALENSPVGPLRNRRLSLAANSMANQYKRENSGFAPCFLSRRTRAVPLGNCSYLLKVLVLALSGCTRSSGLRSGLANSAILLDP